MGKSRFARQPNRKEIRAGRGRYHPKTNCLMARGGGTWREGGNGGGAEG